MMPFQKAMYKFYNEGLRMFMRKIAGLFFCGFFFIGNVSAAESDNELLSRMLGYIKKSNITGVERLVTLQRDRLLSHAAVLRRAVQNAPGSRFSHLMGKSEEVAYISFLVTPVIAFIGGFVAVLGRFLPALKYDPVPKVLNRVSGATRYAIFDSYIGYCLAHAKNALIATTRIGLFALSAATLSCYLLYFPFDKYCKYRDCKYRRVRDFINSRFPQNGGNGAVN